MKVKELIAALGKLDQNLDVLCYTEESAGLPLGHVFRLLDIVDVGETEGEKRKGIDGVPTMRFEKSDHSERLATIEVTSDF